MPMGMPEWDGKAESAQEINRAFNDVLDVLVDADMWTGDPPYRGVSAAEQVKMLVQRATTAEVALAAANARADALAAECDEWRENYAALEAVAIASERERKAAEAVAIASKRERKAAEAALAAVPVAELRRYYLHSRAQANNAYALAALEADENAVADWLDAAQGKEVQP